MRYLLILALIGLGSLASLIRPAYAACFLIWVDIFRPFDWGRLGEPFPLAKIIIVIFAASFVMGLVRRQIAFSLNRGVICIFAYLAWSYFSAQMSPSPFIAMLGFSREIKLLLPMAFVSMTLVRLSDVKALVYTMALCVGVYGAQAGLHAAMVGHPVIDMAIRGGQMSTRNDFMSGLLLAMPLILFIFRNYRGPLRLPARILTFVCLVFCFAAVMFSDSRGGMVGLAALIIITVSLTKKKWRNLGILALVIPFALLAVPQSAWDRLNTLEVGTEQREGSANERLHLMKGGIAMALDHPLTGVGPYSFTEYIMGYGPPKKMEPHSIWIKCAAELGFPGLILLLSGIAWIFFGVFSIYKRAFGFDKTLSDLALSLCMSHIGFCIASTFGNQLYSEYYWCHMALCGGFIKVANARMHRAKERIRVAKAAAQGGYDAEEPAAPAPAAPAPAASDNGSDAEPSKGVQGNAAS